MSFGFVVKYFLNYVSFVPLCALRERERERASYKALACQELNIGVNSVNLSRHWLTFQLVTSKSLAGLGAVALSLRTLHQNLAALKGQAVKPLQ